MSEDASVNQACDETSSINSNHEEALNVNSNRAFYITRLLRCTAPFVLHTNQSRDREGAGYIKTLAPQLLRFGLVGILAATVHYSMVILLVQSYSYEPLSANIIGFFTGFQVSYFGHRHFTFNGTTALHAAALPKLLLLQSFNFLANESLFYFLLWMHLPYQVALLLVLSVLPLFTFTASKCWVFSK